MSRVEENEKMIKHFAKAATEMEGVAYKEIVAWHLGAMNSFLADISKSLAIIADSMPCQKGSEGGDKE